MSSTKSRAKKAPHNTPKETITITYENIITRLIAVWCVTVLIESKVHDFTLISFSEVSLPKFALHYIICFGIVSILHYAARAKGFDAVFLLISLVSFGTALAMANSGPYIMLAVFFVLALCIYYYKDYYLTLIPEIKKEKTAIIITAVIGVLLATILAVITICRFENNSSSTFDMGIYAQMFYNMKDNFSLNTTCERQTLLSHLHVHTSLIYYLFLPVYMIFPHTETLLILQALSVGVGVLPLYLLTKRIGFNNTERVIIVLVYALSPAAFGGVFYDFHENVFLIPLLLFLFWCYESEYLIPTLILSVAVCTVKEDATLFVIILGAYSIISRRNIKRGIIITLIGLIAMAIAFAYIAKYGDGLMTNHYSNLVTPENEGLLGILTTLLTNPGYLVDQIMQEDKIKFLINVILPIGFMAFTTKYLSRYVLLVPFVFVNLLTDYVYQHNIYYQYVFGPYMFILYVAILNIYDIKEYNKRHHYLLLIALVGIVAFISQLSTKTYYIDNYKNSSDTIEILEEAFKEIPDDASVSSTTFLVPKLAKRDTIFMIDGAIVNSNEIFDTDYAIFDLRPGYADENVTAEEQLYVSNGYVEVSSEDDVYVLLKK